MDNLSTEHRRKNMTNIRSKNNRSTERKLRSSLAGAGISGFKMNDTSLPGRPDFSFQEARLAVFVDGCFWHGCPECYVRPKSNQEYWDKKHRTNKARDTKVDESLCEMGWTSVRVWEHTLKDPRSTRKVISACIQQHSLVPPKP